MKLQRKIKMRFILLLHIILATTFFANAQISVMGKVSNASQLPIAYCRIQVNQSGYILSNNEGFFKLTVAKLPCEIVIIRMGFDSLALKVGDTSFLNVVLKEKAYAIKEVIIDGNYPNKLFDKSFHKLLKDQRYVCGGDVFYRMTTKNNGDYTELLEAFYKVKARQSGFQTFNITNGRYAIDSSFRRKGYTLSLDFSSLIRLLDITNDHRTSIKFPDFPYSKSMKKKFVFYNQTSKNNLSVIGFRPKNNKANAFNGKLFINELNGSLHRIEASYKEATSSLLMAYDTGKKLSDLTLNYSIDFIEGAKGVMQIGVINLDIGYNVEKNNVKSRNTTKIECVMYNHTLPKKSAEYFNTQNQSSAFDYYQIFRKMYVKQFWDEQEVLLQNKAQKKLTTFFNSNNLFVGSINNTVIFESFKEFGFLPILDDKLPIINMLSKQNNNLEKDAMTIELSADGNGVAALNNRLYVIDNCYKDSFYYSVVPVVNSFQSWISDSLAETESFNNLVNLYLRLARIHAAKLTKTLMILPQPCRLKNTSIEQIVAQANTDLLNEELELLNDLWTNVNFDFWEKYIRKEEILFGK